MPGIVHLPPDDCPYCGALNLNKTGSISFSDSSLICYACGILVEATWTIEERQTTDLATSINLTLCPHCNNVGTIAEYAGEEWCHACGLDPNVTNYPSAKIAHLWKAESGIRKVLERDISVLAPHKRLGIFIRSICGPKCKYAEVCPQTVKNLTVCGNEDWEASRTEDEMSKRKRKRKNKKNKNISNLFKKEIVQPTLLVCAKHGWFEEIMNDKLMYRQQSGDKRGGSRT